MNKKIISGVLTFIMILSFCGQVSAADASDIGQKVAQKALQDKNLGLAQDNGTICITNAGALKLDDNTTTEGSFQGIIDTMAISSLSDNQKITYGKSNIITMNDPFGTLQYTFVSKNSNGGLWAKKFTVTGTSTSYTINSGKTVFIGENMTTTQWNNAVKQLGGNAFNLISIANAWASKAPLDLLAVTESTGGVKTGLISGYAMTKGFMQQYPAYMNPPKMAWGKEYIILTTSGGYNDCPSYFMPWNHKYYAMKGGNPLESAYILWNTPSKTGVLTLMKFNDTLYNLFQRQTGIKVVNGTLSEIKFNNWLINILNNNPGQLINVEQTVNATQNDLYYLYGNENQTGQGLNDAGKSYISNNMTKTAPFTMPSKVVPNDDYTNMFNIGQTIAQKAQTILNDLPTSGNGQIAVETAPIYASVDNTFINGIYDGIATVIGTDANNLIGIRNPWNFDSYVNHYLNSIFFQKGADSSGNSIINLIEVQYDHATGKIAYSQPAVLKLNKIGGTSFTSAKNDTGNLSDQSFWSMPAWIRTADAWASGASYDSMNDFIKISCCCWAPGIEASSDSILQTLPLHPNEHYILIGQGYQKQSTFGVAKTSAGMMAALDVSPGTGTFFATGEVYDPNFNGIIIRWNDLTNTGTAALTYFDTGKLRELQNAETDPELKNTAPLNYYRYITEGKTIATASDINTALQVTKEVSINAADLTALTAGGVNPVQFITNFVPSQPDNQNGNSTNNPENPTNNQGSSQGSDTTNSVGTAAGLAVTAAVQDNGQNTESGKTAHEVTPVDQTGSKQSGTPIWGIVGVILIIILIAVGYFRKSLFDLRK